MKSVLISIQPKWCELIASGKKTVEVQKTRPQEVPFRAYIYQTKKKWIYKILEWLGLYQEKVIGEFVCDRIDEYSCEFYGDDDYMSEFHAMEQIQKLAWREDYPGWEKYDYITGNEKDDPDDCELCKQSCLSYAQIRKCIGIYKYIGKRDKTFYGWHISALKIYDKPKELGEFRSPCNMCLDCIICRIYVRGESGSCSNKITCSPTSWRYVEEKNG